MTLLKIQNEFLPNQGRINNEPSQFDIQKLSSNTNLIPNPKLRSIARSKATRQPKTQNGDAQNQELTNSETLLINSQQLSIENNSIQNPKSKIQNQEVQKV